jgi:hypothetical protein
MKSKSRGALHKDRIRDAVMSSRAETCESCTQCRWFANTLAIFCVTISRRSASGMAQQLSTVTLSLVQAILLPP